MTDLARNNPDTGPIFIENTPVRLQKYHDKLFRDDSKRVPLPWNRQINAAFPASFGT
ncbi:MULTISPECIES: hypothetical protein [unclassified Mesorhizobium]|uniref:hypothetical protein n=1 Tax=unclassified Mesorhizobium TaxID=325217 RepID=UPI00142F21F3|nr:MULTISPECIES: hypothetical protein [unclassified Mesorhizobium]